MCSPAGAVVSTKINLCQECGKEFDAAPELAQMFPLWQLVRCPSCGPRQRPREPLVTVDAVLESTAGGSDHGIFVGASCDPNPGPGGWATVRVLGGTVVREVFGDEPATTNSRMELRAVIEGMRMALPTERVTVYSSSQTVVNTLKDWAPAWARNGWRRGPKRERVSNLDLVTEAYRTYLGRPNATVAWLASDGPSKWARYAHALARSYLLGAA